MLLYWGTVEPAGPSQVAALRFSQAVHVRSIRLFPKDARPFSQVENAISETEPESFKLEVFFNAQHMPNHPAEGRQKASNALVPTTIAYVGDPIDFDIEMGPEWATRLLILSGKFQKLSLAIYGETVAELAPALAPYEPSILPVAEPTALSSTLDTATHHDPTRLARSLLTLIPDAPPLALIIRLMFTLKPANDDWDIPEFPYIHPNLEGIEDFDLQAAAQITNKPVSDDIAYESLEKFADRVAETIGPKSIDQAYDAANLLAHAAPQHPEMARLLVSRLDLRAIFGASTVENDTLSRLLIAAANPDIARALAKAQVADHLRPEHRARLAARLEGWIVLSDALWNTQADFRAARKFLDDVGCDEPSFGVVLHALIQHSDLSARLAENPVIPDTPLISDSEGEVETHDEFIAYLRAWLGVSCVLSVYAWADSLPVVRGRERALGILSVWQEFKGYREIVNHLMLSRQMLFRLDCMMDDEEPSRSGMLAERMLLTLSRVPTSFNSQYLVKTILGLPSGLTVIDDDERLALRDLAHLTDDGLQSAIEELSHPPERPINARDLLALRVALVVMGKELRRGLDGEFSALRVLWDQHGHGLTLHLVESFAALASDIAAYFSVSPPLPGPSGHIGNLFSAASELVRELQEFIPAYSLPGRALRSLTVAICDVFACADAADFRFTPGNDESVAAQRARQCSIDLARLLVRSKEEKSFVYASTVFRTLLQHASNPGDRDPAYHVTRMLDLIDYLLPMPREDAMAVEQEELAVNWATPIIPRALSDITTFFRILDPENRTHFLLRMSDIDDGVAGVGEWLMLDELKRLQRAADAASLEDDTISRLHRYEIVSSLKLVHNIISSPASGARRLIEYIAGELEPATALTASLTILLSKRLFSPVLVQIAARFLEVWSTSFAANLRFSLSFIFLRGLRSQGEPPVPYSRSSLLKSATAALEGTPIKIIDPERLRDEIRDTLLVVNSSSSPFSEPTALSTIIILDWLVKQSHAGLPQLSALRGISADTLSSLFERLAQPVDADALERLDRLRATITTRGEDVSVAANVLVLQTIQISVDELDNALRAGIPTPSTPKRTTPPHAQSMFSLATVSPPTALLRSPAVTGLTRTYNSNDFRTLRQTPSARQNTSRLPSTHVDDFEMVSPQMLPAGLPGGPSQFNPGDGGFGNLAAPFGGV